VDMGHRKQMQIRGLENYQKEKNRIKDEKIEEGYLSSSFHSK